MLITGIPDKESSKHKQNRSPALLYIIGQLIIFIILVSVTTILVRPFQQTLQKQMTELRDRLIAQGEELLGRRITYSSIGPSLFRTLDIRDIQIAGKDAEPVLTIAQIRISYSLLTLLRGEILESLREVQLDRPRFSFDLEQDQDLLELFTRQTTPDHPQGESALTRFINTALPGNLRLRIRNGEVRITGTDRLLSAEALNLEVSLHRQRFRFQGASNLEFQLPQSLGEPALVQSSLGLSGEWSADFQNGNATLKLSAFAEDLFTIQPLTVNITMGDNRLSLKKINDQAGFDCSLDYDIIPRRLSGTFKSEGFSPQNSLTLGGPWEDLQQWLGARISGTASFTQDPIQGLRYALDLAGTLPLKKASFGIRGTGDQEQITLDSLSVRIAQGTLKYQGTLSLNPLLPEGRISIADFSLSGKDPLNAQITFQSQEREVRFKGTAPSFGSLSNLQGSILAGDQSLTFEASLGGSDPQTEGFSLEGFLTYPSSLEMRLDLKGPTITDISALIRPFYDLPNPAEMVPVPAAQILHQVGIRTTLYITTDLKHLSYHAPELEITYEDRESLFTGTLSGTERRFQLHQGRVRWEGVDLAASAQAEFTNLEDLSFSLEATYLDKPYYFQGMILDQSSLTIQGLYGLQVYANKGDAGGYSGYAEVENLPIPYRGQTARFSMKSSLRYDSPEQWSLEMEGFEIADALTPLSLGNGGTRIGFTGSADSQGAQLREIFFDDGRGALQGEAVATWDYQFSHIAGELKLHNEGGNEWYDLTAQKKNKELTLKLAGSDMQIGRFTPQGFNGVASGELDLQWNNSASFSGAMHLKNFSAKVSNKEVRITGEASLDPDTFQVQALHVRYGEFQVDLPQLVLNRRESRGEAEAQFQIVASGRDVDLSFKTAVEFKSIDSWFKIQEAIHTFEGRIQVDAARFNTIHVEEPFEFNFSRTPTLFFLIGGPRNMIRLQLADTGDFYAGLSYPAPIRGTLIGAINPADQSIDAFGRDIYVDLTALWQFIPPEVKKLVNLTGGFVTASIGISGPLGDPEFSGTLVGNSVRLEVPQYLTREVRPVPLTVVLAGKEMLFAPTPASVGEGQGTVSGFFKFDRWIPNSFELDIQVPPQSPIPFGIDILGVMASGNASGDLTVAMQDMTVKVSGNILGDTTEITLNTDELVKAAQAQDEEDSDFNFAIVVDLALKTGRKVEFLWPNARWPILQASADLGSELRIRNDTLSRKFSVFGDVRLRSGELFYFERSFYIRQGVLSFNENENRFEPRISLRAEVRDQISTGPVLISMIVNNAPLQNFTPRFEASPPLSQLEIFTLLGQNLTGAPREEGSGASQIPALTSTMDILAQSLLAQSQTYRQIYRRIRDTFTLDMLSFRTQILQNLAVQTITQNRKDTVDKNGIGNYFDNTTVFIGKYLTPDMFLQGMVSLRYGENRNAFRGVTMGGYTLEPDLGIEVRGPLFDIQFHQGFLHYESLFFMDASLSLIRKRSSWKDMFLHFP